MVSPTVTPLTPLTASLFLITGVRALIGIAAFVAIVEVAGRDDSLRLGFAGGAGITAVAALYRMRLSPHFVLRSQAEPVPPDVGRASWWRIAARAAYPSTIGVAILLAIAAPLNATLASILAGVEVGLALMSLAVGGENALWERRAGVVVEYAHGSPPLFFARPHRHRWYPI